MYEEIFAKIRREDVIDMTQKLVRINTEYYHDDFSRFDYMPMAEFMVDEMKKLGMETHIVGKPHFPNAIGRLRGSEGKPSLLVTGHYNTVPIGDRSLWTHDPFGAEIVGDKIYGRGATDMKDGDAAAMVAIKALVESGVKLKGDLIAFWWAGEGASGHSVDWVAENHPELIKADWGLKCEGALRTTCSGLLWLKLVTTGKSVHAGLLYRPLLRAAGIRNALSDMLKLLTAMEKVDDWMTWEPEPMFGPDTKPGCSVTVLKSGDAVNIIPDRATADVDIRFMPSQTKEVILKELNVLIEKVKAENPSLEVESINDFYHLPAMKIPKNHYIITTTQDVVEEVLGFRPEVIAAGSLPVADLLPTAMVGGIVKKGYGAHAIDEWTSIDSAVDLTKVFAALYQKILG